MTAPSRLPNERWPVSYRRQRQQESERRRQVNFDNRTALFRLILERKFVAAEQRAQEHPEEAAVWIVVEEGADNESNSITSSSHRQHQRRRRESWPPKVELDNDNHGRDGSLQQLPLHLACAVLSPKASDDEDDQAQLEALISTLVTVYPEACRERDASGVLPLHRILFCRPSIDLVLLMIAANPDAALLDHTTTTTLFGKQDEYTSRLENVLQQGKQALLRSRQDAGLWFLLGVQGLGAQDEDPRRVADTASLLQSAYFRLDVQQMMATNIAEESNGHDTSEYNDVQSLERLLKNLLARNEAYADVLLTLAQERIKSDKIPAQSPRDEQHSQHGDDKYYDLQDQNSYLRKRIHDLEMTLRDLGFNNKNDNDFSPNIIDGGELMSVMGMDPERPSPLTKYMETKVTELQEEMDGLESENDRLLAQVEELQSLVMNIERKNSEIEMNASDDVHSVRSKLLSVHSSEERSDVRVSSSAAMFQETPASTPTGSDNESRHGDDPVLEEEARSVPKASGDDYRQSKSSTISRTERGHYSGQTEVVEESKRLALENAALLQKLEEVESSRDSSAEAVSIEEHRLEKENLIKENKIFSQRIEDLEKALDEKSRGREVPDDSESMSLTIDSLSAAVDSHSMEVIQLQKQVESISIEASRKEDELRHEILKLQQQLSDTRKENEVQRSEAADIGRTSTNSSRFEVSSDSFSTNHTERSALLGEKLKAVDRLSGHDGHDHMDDDEVSCSTPSSEHSAAASLALSSAMVSPHSLHDSEKLGSKASSSFTRSHNNSLSSGKTVSNRSTSSWAVLSATQSGKRKGRRPRKLKSLVRALPNGANPIESFHSSLPDLAKTFFRDDLGSMLKMAAEFYHDFSEKQTETGEDILISLDSSFAGSKSNRKQKRRYSDGGASPLVLLHEKTLSETERNDNLEQTALLLTFEEDMLFIVSRAEEILRFELSEDLVSALQESCFLHLNSTSHSMSRHSIPAGILDATLVEEIEAIYGKPVPEQVLSALCEASNELIESTNNEILAMEKMKDRLEQEFLDALIDAAQTRLPDSIPIDLVASLRTAAASFDQLLEESADESRNDYTIQVDFRRLSVLFRTAEEVYGRRFPDDVLVALREASFVLQSRLDGTDLAGSVWDLSSRGDIDQFEADTPVGNILTPRAGNSSVYPKPLDGRDVTSDKGGPRNDDDAVGDDTVDSKSLLTDEDFVGSYKDDVDESKSRASDDTSLDLVSVFNRKQSVEIVEKLKGGDESDRIQDTNSQNWDSSGLTDDGTPAYVPPSQRGRSPRRKMAPRRGSEKDLDSTAKRTVDEIRRSRSADSKFGDMARRRFGSDDLEEIYERATKEVGMSSLPSSSGLSMSSSGSFISYASIRYGSGEGEQDSLDSILDAFLSDTEETYGIEISESVILALKKAVELSVNEAAPIPVIRALHDDAVIDQASRFNNGEIPSDLVEAIRLTSLPPGVSAQSLKVSQTAMQSATAVQKSRGSTGRSKSAAATRSMAATKQAFLESQAKITKIQKDEQSLDDVETSWHKISTSPAVGGLKKTAERGRITESEAVAVRKEGVRGAARERKRQAEKHLGNSLADFGGNADDLQDLVTHAKEALGIHRVAITDKSENDGSMTITSELTESLRAEARFQMVMEATHVLRPTKPDSSISSSPQDLELDLLLSEMEKDPSFKPDFDFDVALRRASRSIDETLDSVAPARELPDVVYGTFLPWWRLEIILGEAEVFLGKEISAAKLSKIIDAASRLTMQEPTVGRDVQPGKDPSEMASAATPKSPTSKHMREIDDLSKIYKTAYSSSPRPDLSDRVLPAVRSPPAPPNFTALAAERSNKRKSFEAPGSGAVPSFSDSFVSIAMEEEDDLSKIFRNAYTEAPRADNTARLASMTERSPPKPSFESGHRSVSMGDLKSPPLEKRTPILSKFLELNRRELLERTQSGREIPMVSPVTEPTMDSGSNLAERFLALAQTIPDLEETPEAEGENTLANEDSDRETKIPACGHDSIAESGVGSKNDVSSRDSKIDSGRESMADSRLSRLDDASFDTYRELEAILLETKEELGTELSMDLVAAVKKAASSEIDPDSLHDSKSLLMEHLASESEAPSTDESTLHGIAIELSRKFSTSVASEASHSLSDLVHALKTKLSESKQKGKQVEPTVWASKHYLDSLVTVATSELGKDIPAEMANKIRGASIQANINSSPAVSWEQIEYLLQQVCEGYDEDTWFEIQEAFFKAWESCSTSEMSRPISRNTSKWGEASGFISAVSESSVSALMDDPDDFDQFQDIFEEMKRIHGRVPREVLDRLKLENSATSSMSDLEQSRELGDSVTSGLVKTLGDSNSLEYSKSIQHEQSQSSFSLSPSPGSRNSPYGSQKAVHMEESEVERLGLIQEEERSDSQTSSSVTRDVAISQTTSESDGQPNSLQRAASKSNSTVSSLSSSVHTHGSDGEYSVELNSGESDSLRNSPGSHKSGSKSIQSAPSPTLAISMPSSRPPMERTQSTHSIQSSHSVTVNRALGPDILKELEKKYPGDIPDELVFVLKNSILIPYSMNSDEDLSIILRECESLSQTSLPADLVLAVREASVSVRNPSTSSRSRRGRLMKQHSGSFRSTSRSSGMPMIAETGDTSNGNAASKALPAEIETAKSVKSPFKPARSLSRKDSADPGIPLPSLESQVIFGSMDSSGHSAHSGHSFVSESDESISLKSLHDEEQPASLPDQISPGTQFNLSEATQLVSNTAPEERRLGRDLQMDMGTIHSLSTSLASTIEDADHDLDSVHSDTTARSSNRSLQPSISTSSMGYQLGMSSGHSSRHTDEGNRDRSHSTSNISTVSRTSTLASRRLPVGVDVSPPVAGVESDDLAEIFAVAARRMSRLVEGKMSAEIDRRPVHDRRKST